MKHITKALVKQTGIEVVEPRIYHVGDKNIPHILLVFMYLFESKDLIGKTLECKYFIGNKVKIINEVIKEKNKIEFEIEDSVFNKVGDIKLELSLIDGEDRFYLGYINLPVRGEDATIVEDEKEDLVEEKKENSYELYPLIAKITNGNIVFNPQNHPFLFPVSKLVLTLYDKVSGEVYLKDVNVKKLTSNYYMDLSVYISAITDLLTEEQKSKFVSNNTLMDYTYAYADMAYDMTVKGAKLFDIPEITGLDVNLSLDVADPHLLYVKTAMKDTDTMSLKEYSIIKFIYSDNSNKDYAVIFSGGSQELKIVFYDGVGADGNTSKNVVVNLKAVELTVTYNYIFDITLQIPVEQITIIEN